MNDRKTRTECSLFLVFMLLFIVAFSRNAYAASDSSAMDAAVNEILDMPPESGSDSAAETVTGNDDAGNPVQPDAGPVTSNTDVLPAAVEAPSLAADTLNLLAGGNFYKLQVQNADSASYQLSSPGVVQLSEETAQSVTITPSAAGNTVLTVTAAADGQAQTVLACVITVSELSVSQDVVEIYMNDTEHSADISIQGPDLDAVYYGGEWDDDLRDALDYSSECLIQAGNEEVAKACFLDGAIHISGIAKGVTNIRGTIFGVPFSMKVRVYHYTLNKYAINTYKGSTQKTLKVKGAGTQKAEWSSGNKNVVEVSKNGVVTIKGIGATKITAKVNGRKLICIVAVSSKTAARVIKDARAIAARENVRYSQAYRMSQNYYDCSSLVYRCYKPYGIRFGYTTPGWAPTAAAECLWCVSTGHTVASQSVDILSCKLVPGDTIYYSFNGNNGRYLNIDHTAVFAGYAYDEASGYYGTVIEASSSKGSVVERMYYPGQSIMLIGRPSKK